MGVLGIFIFTRLSEFLKHQHRGKSNHTEIAAYQEALLSLLSSRNPLLCASETKRPGRRNLQPLIKFPLLFLSVPPMMFSYRFWARALCESQEDKQVIRLWTRILHLKSRFCLFFFRSLSKLKVTASAYKSQVI